VDDPDDPALMSEEARAREVAELLATGYLRYRALRARGAAPATPPGTSERPAEEPPRQPENEVDASRDRSVHASRAVGSAPAAELEVLG
jgi:hypothetical protein